MDESLLYFGEQFSEADRKLDGKLPVFWLLRRRIYIQFYPVRDRHGL